jgi:propanediol dehydratase small subunit
MPGETKVELTIRVSPQALAALTRWARDCGAGARMEGYLEDAAEALAIPEIYAQLRSARIQMEKMAIAGAPVQAKAAAEERADA